jgi:hypothetical protein
MREPRPLGEAEDSPYRLVLHASGLVEDIRLSVEYCAISLLQKMDVPGRIAR